MQNCLRKKTVCYIVVSCDIATHLRFVCVCVYFCQMDSEVNEIVQQLYRTGLEKTDAKKRKVKDVSTTKVYDFTLEPDIPPGEEKEGDGEKTLEELIESLQRPNSWETVRMFLVLRKRAERQRRLYYQQYVRASSAAQHSSSNNIERNDEYVLHKTIAARCEKAIDACNETLRLLKPSSKSATEKNWTVIINTLLGSLRRFSRLIGMHSLKADVTRLIQSLWTEEVVAMPDDYANTPTLSDLLADIVVGTSTAKVPISEQTLHDSDKKYETHKNILFYGQPGTGKSTSAAFVAHVLAACGYLPLRELPEVDASNRAELVGQYSGQSSIKTKQKLASSIGGALFIDEVYGLITRVGEDDFGQEAVDGIVFFLTAYEGLIMLIGAGYEEDITNRLFEANSGFESRFPNKFRLANYTAEELYTIIVTALPTPGTPEELDYELTAQAGEVLRGILNNSVQRQVSLFENKNARGALTLLQKIKQAQAARAIREIKMSNTLKSPGKKIIVQDVLDGFEDWVRTSFHNVKVVYGE